MTTTKETVRPPRVHWAWVVAATGFVAILGAAGFRSVPGVMMMPLHDEFGWSHGTVGMAMSVNMTLFGLTAPFAAALMDRFGVRAVLTVALALISAGSALSVLMTASWQLVLLWGVLVGVGTGSISMGFVATIATRWFEARRGLVTGVLTAASATGQLIFLPVIAEVTVRHGWRWASLIVAAAAVAVVPLVLVFMRNHPGDRGLTAYGATGDAAVAVVPAGSFRAAFDGLRMGLRVPAFWLLAGSFAICGMTTNGLIGTHFIPAAHDHGMPTTVAAGLLATIGVLDVAGTVFSGWLTDRVDPRLLLVVYYTGRGVSLRAAARAAVAARGAEHVGLHRLLRPRLGRDRAADDRAVPSLLRRPHARRVRLGVRVPPDRRRRGGRGRGVAAGPPRQLRLGVLPGRGAVRRRRDTLRERAESPAQRRLTEVRVRARLCRFVIAAFTLPGASPRESGSKRRDQKR